MRCIPSLLLAVSIVAPAGASAAGPCDRLAGERRSLADKITRATYPYDCCDETLEQCLRQKKVCKLARRLRDDICRRVARGEDDLRLEVFSGLCMKGEHGRLFGGEGG